METPSLSGHFPKPLVALCSSPATTLWVGGGGVLGLLAFVALPLVLFLALLLIALSTSSFAVARAVARQSDEVEPFVHGPTILPPAV